MTDANGFEVSPSLARVARGDSCAGCGACASLAPGAVEMTLSPPGFARPRQTGLVPAEAEAAIAAVCPGLGHRIERAGPDGEPRETHPLWGPYLEMRTGHAADPALRHAASSGGALSAVLVHLLEEGHVEGVLQVGPHPEIAVANAVTLSRSASEVAEAAGSRYAPSSPLEGIEGHLSEGRPLAFVGKPCDVAALRALSRRDPRVDQAFPWKISFFCAGVPSRSGAEEVLKALGTTPEKTAAFRYRGMGWPGRATARADDGTERSMTYHESWGRILSRHVQHRCKICADGTGTDADLVCADAWESDERGYPVFEEADGVSLIVARTARGAELMARAEDAGAIATQPFDVADLRAIQPGQVNRRQALLARLTALRLLGRPVPRYRGLAIAAAAATGRPGWQARNFLGTLRRNFRRRS